MNGNPSKDLSLTQKLHHASAHPRMLFAEISTEKQHKMDMLLIVAKSVRTPSKTRTSKSRLSTPIARAGHYFPAALICQFSNYVQVGWMRV